MRSISARSWALVFLSAILQIAIFPIAGPLPAWRAALSWFALIPFLLALLQPDRTGVLLSPRSAALLGYACGTLWYMGNCYWIYQTMHQYGGIPEPVSFIILVLFALYLGLYHALFATIIAALRSSKLKMRGALWLVPFVWVAVELARARITGFPWDLLGYTQIDNFVLTSLAPIAGVMAISFVVAAINAALVPFFLEAHRRIPGVALILAIGFVLVGVIGRKSEVTPIGLTHIAVMMQENIEVGAVGREAAPLGVSDEIAMFSGWSLHPLYPDHATSIPSPGVAPTVIVWPEAPSHLFSTDPYFRSALGQLAHAANAPVIAGSIGIDRDGSAENGFYEYDSASLFTPNGTYAGRYDKIHLVPWGEYTPFPAVFGFVHKLTEGIGAMTPGHERSVLTTGGHTYGIFVCYESIFGDEVRQFAANGAEVLVNISDDGWYGDSGAPWQHLNMARMRAIENHRWVLRDTNTGITTAIDPEGRMAAQAPRHTRAAYAFPFAFESTSSKTFYTRHGDWFAYLCTLVTLAALTFSLFSRTRILALK